MCYWHSLKVRVEQIIIFFSLTLFSPTPFIPLCPFLPLSLPRTVPTLLSMLINYFISERWLLVLVRVGSSAGPVSVFTLLTICRGSSEQFQLLSSWDDVVDLEDLECPSSATWSWRRITFKGGLKELELRKKERNRDRRKVCLMVTGLVGREGLSQPCYASVITEYCVGYWDSKAEGTFLALQRLLI